MTTLEYNDHNTLLCIINDYESYQSAKVVMDKDNFIRLNDYCLDNNNPWIDFTISRMKHLGLTGNVEAIAKDISEHYRDERIERFKSSIISIDISGRRWFDKRWGNTYNSSQVRVIIYQPYMLNDKRTTFFVPFSYGYGDQYIVNAIDAINERIAGYAVDYYKQRNFINCSVVDVLRKKDLHTC